MKKANKNQRFRNYATIVYVESAIDGWKQIIIDSCIPAFISPYHDKDFNPDKTEKKPHYHVLLMFDGVQTVEQAETFISSFGGVGCEIIKSKRGYARYLCHLDNPEKFRYCTDDVIESGGADYSAVCSTCGDRKATIKAMINFVRNNHITSYCDLFDYAMDHEPEWYDALSTNSSYVISTYITDYRRSLNYDR